MNMTAALIQIQSHAGAGQHAAVHEVSAEVADKTIQLNVLSPVALSRAALPLFPSRRHCRLAVVSFTMAALTES